MRKTISVAALLLALTCPAYAGEMQNDSPKPPSNAAQEPSGGEISTGGTTAGETPDDATDTLTQVALDLLAVLPSLL